MHATQAFLNGAGITPGPSAHARKTRGLLHALLSSCAESTRTDLGDAKSKDERQAEEEDKEKTVSKPGGFDNDPDDPKNPNEVRERHLKKIKR